MSLEQYHHLKHLVISIANYLVPPHAERIPITSQNAWLCALPHVTVILMAGLARTRGTWLIRLALFPIVIVIILRFSYAYFVDNIESHGMNQNIGGTGFVELGYVIFFAWHEHGVLKMGEVEPGVPAISSTTNGNGNGNANGKHKHKKTHPKTPHENAQLASASSSSNFFLRAFELLLNPRGIGWKFGTGSGIYCAPDWRNLSSRYAFLKQTLWQIGGNFLLLDMVNSILDRSNVRVAGGTIFGRGGNWMESLAISTWLTVLTGLFLLISFNLGQVVLSFIAVLIKGGGDSPLVDVGWGPLLDHPWLSQSLHEFWGTRWQQGLRQLFLVLGGYPLQAVCRIITRMLSSLLCLPEARAGQVVKLAGDVGLIVGVFFISGVCHTVPQYACGPIIDASGRLVSANGMPGWSSINFFLAQALGVIIERVYRLATGKYVNGIFGRVWTLVWVVGGSQYLFNSWYNVGFQRGKGMDPNTSPTEQLIIPLLHQLSRVYSSS
ncbi:hypothetical protein DL93DRAFT_2082308 [Clavulina sp. PMI_390]|nr:hypothetical protein DL93DRAFT_2082308 [Clavulina sp. PMI_390]